MINDEHIIKGARRISGKLTVYKLERNILMQEIIIIMSILRSLFLEFYPSHKFLVQQYLILSIISLKRLKYIKTNT